MRDYIKSKLNKRRVGKVMASGAIVAIVLGTIFVLIARHVYIANLSAINTGSNTEVVVAIPSGSSLDEISKLLKNKKVIRADWAFKRYVTNKEESNSLKAGTYRFKVSQNVDSIVKDLVDGNVDVELFTIFPAQRLGQIRQEFIDKGFSPDEVDEALKPNHYSTHPALVDKPVAANLEGYLYPDSYQRVAETTPSTIIAASLDEMAKVLTPDIRSNLAKQGLNVYQGIILASIVEQEIPSAPLSPKSDRRQAAQVFLKRIKIGMQLGSDSTALYGTVISGQPPSVTYDTPYNTRIHTGFPPGPIGNVTFDGLDAVANPAGTDFLYFVSGDDKVTYFSKTLAEHEAATAQHCKQLCKY